MAFKRRLLVPAVVAILFLATPRTSAVIWGLPDGDGHPYVGLAVFASGGVLTHSCSGALLAPTVFLTAGHCTAGADVALVWFESDVSFSAATVFVGTPATHPAYNNFAGFPNTSDVGVVILDRDKVLEGYAELPPVGALSALDRRRGLQNQVFTIVGYGVQAVVPFMQDEYIRYRGIPMVVELGSALSDGFNLHLSSNRGRRAPGGLCFGDSGGPALIGSSNVVAGVGSFVLNANCVGAGFYYRVDTAYAQQFIQAFLQ